MSELRVVREFRAELIGSKSGARPPSRRPTRRGLAIVLAVLLLCAGIAVAATRGIPIGSPISGPEPRFPEIAPVEGTGRLAPVRAADPAGGPSWGVRSFRSRRGLTCVQIGRVVGGRLGVIGDDGAFHAAPVAVARCTGVLRGPGLGRGRRGLVVVAGSADMSLRRSTRPTPTMTADGAPPGAYSLQPCQEGTEADTSFDPHVVICDDRPRRWVDTDTVEPGVVAIVVEGPGVHLRAPVVGRRYLIVRAAPLPPRTIAYAVRRDGRRSRVWGTPSPQRAVRVRTDPAVIRRARLRSAPAVVGRDEPVVVSLLAPPRLARYGNFYEVVVAGPSGCPRQGRLSFTVSAMRPAARRGRRLRFAIRPPGQTVPTRAEWCRGRYSGSVALRGRVALGRFSFRSR